MTQKDSDIKKEKRLQNEDGEEEGDNETTGLT